VCCKKGLPKIIPKATPVSRAVPDEIQGVSERAAKIKNNICFALVVRRQQVVS
jgi:hypothetical protein